TASTRRFLSYGRLSLLALKQVLNLLLWLVLKLLFHTRLCAGRCRSRLSRCAGVRFVGPQDAFNQLFGLRSLHSLFSGLCCFFFGHIGHCFFYLCRLLVSNKLGVRVFVSIAKSNGNRNHGRGGRKSVG